jgi:hypothetical protein
MSDQIPPKRRSGSPAVERQRTNVQDLRRLADSCRGLKEPTLMAKAWDERVAMNSPRKFGQLQDLSVRDVLDELLPDAEITVWEGDSPRKS